MRAAFSSKSSSGNLPRRLWLLGLTFALTTAANFAFSVEAFAAPPTAAQKVCPSSSGQGRLTAPPTGFVRYVEYRVLDDCTVAKSAVRLIRPIEIPHLIPGSILVDPSLTQHARSWDCCGILMNELSTTLQWNGISGSAYPYNQFNSTSYHTEAPPSRGWWLDYQNLWYPGCSSACSPVLLRGNAGFGYQGVFDPSGTWYYNSYENYVYGYGNGYGECSYSYYWRGSAPGWNLQQWCGA